MRPCITYDPGPGVLHLHDDLDPKGQAEYYDGLTPGLSDEVAARHTLGIEALKAWDGADICDNGETREIAIDINKAVFSGRDYLAQHSRIKKLLHALDGVLPPDYAPDSPYDEVLTVHSGRKVVTLHSHFQHKIAANGLGRNAMAAASRAMLSILNLDLRSNLQPIYTKEAGRETLQIGNSVKIICENTGLDSTFHSLRLGLYYFDNMGMVSLPQGDSHDDPVIHRLAPNTTLTDRHSLGLILGLGTLAHHVVHRN